MRILFLSHYFPPEVNAPASRTFEHCREWVRLGHEVTVVTCAPNHPKGQVYQGYRNRLWQKEHLEGIEVIRVWTFLAANQGFLLRTFNYVSFMLMTTVLAPFLARFDVVVTTSPQFFNGLAGYPVSRIKRIPWVLEIRDLWPESILTVGAIKNPTVIRILEWLEKFAYRKADKIVPVTDSFEQFIINKGILKEKVCVIKNGVDLTLFAATEINQDLIRELDLEGKFVVSYFGTHGMAHCLSTVLEAAEILRYKKNIVFLLVGEGAEKSMLEEKKQKMKLDNVIMLPQQAKERMPALWAMTDLSLVHLRKSDLFKTVIPSKIFESMAMRRPIVLGVDGEVRMIVEKAGSGVYFEPENAAALSETVLHLFKNSNECKQMGINGRSAVTEMFDRRVLARRYLDLLAECV